VTSFDYILLSISCFLVVRGLIKGFIREILGLVSLIAGFVVAYLFADELASIISNYIESDQGAAIVSYAILFIFSTLIISYISRLLTSLSKAVSLGLINRILGGVFGLLKSIVILFVIWYLLDLIKASFDVELPPELANSQLLTAIDEVVAGLS
jgi:membrane protein required for colicin V production